MLRIAANIEAGTIEYFRSKGLSIEVTHGPAAVKIITFPSDAQMMRVVGEDGTEGTLYTIPSGDVWLLWDATELKLIRTLVHRSREELSGLFHALPPPFQGIDPEEDDPADDATTQ